MNSFKYSLDNKRYHTFNYYLKTKYNAKIAKVILDAGFTCPNRDGTKGYGGCIYCSNSGSGDSNQYTKEDILKQYEDNKKVMDNKWTNNLYIPYFQSFSNTYGSLEKIQNMIEPFILKDEVAEIALATRCDCIKEDVINYLDTVSYKKPIWLELGLQTSNENTAAFINRGHTFEEFKDMLYRLEKTNIKVCVHIMNGLPYETEEMMIQTIKDICDLPFEGIKIHMLHIIKNTRLADYYEKNPFEILKRDKYIEIVVKQLELLRPEVIVQRLTGDPIKEDLIAPEWVLNKTTILNDIDKLMNKMDTYQGKKRVAN